MSRIVAQVATTVGISSSARRTPAPPRRIPSPPRRGPFSRRGAMHRPTRKTEMETPRDKHVLLFDSDCPMCTFQSRTLSWLDWLHQVEMVPLKDPRTAEIAPDITREDLLEAIHCVTPSGEIRRGARAIRFLGMRIPLLVPVGLFLWIPGVIWIAEKVYAWV